MFYFSYLFVRLIDRLPCENEGLQDDKRQRCEACVIITLKHTRTAKLYSIALSHVIADVTSELKGITLRFHGTAEQHCRDVFLFSLIIPWSLRLHMTQSQGPLVLPQSSMFTSWLLLLKIYL